MSNKFIGNETGYLDRKINTQSLGFNDYKHYLTSDLWKSIKKHVLLEFDSKCQFCEQKSKDIHHAKYDKDTLLGVKFDHMYPVCRECHAYGEYDENGDKYGPIASLGRMYNKCKETFGEDYAKLRLENRKLKIMSISWEETASMFVL